MEYINADFETTAVVKAQYPDTSLPEIALVGRSNVGKSSLINCILNRRKLARTSSTPGKTATINFYNVEKKFRIVDLPGYGQAVIQLVDSRHKPTADDIMMADWVKRCGYYTYVVATKLDKLKKSEIDKNLTCIYSELELDEDCVLIPFSSENKAGREEVLELIEYILSGKAEEDR